MPGMQVRIEPRDTDVEVSDRDVDEIIIRGSSMMSGYLGDTPLGVDEWFRTGDLGYFVDDALVVCGRAKDIITVAGRNVFPAEVEQLAGRVRACVREPSSPSVSEKARPCPGWSSSRSSAAPTRPAHA